MKKYFILLILLIPSLSWGACPGTPTDCYVKTGTDPYTYTAIDCSYDAVNQSVQAASSGDTVVIPACSETTWNSSLTITTPIVLQGQGIGVTNILSTASSYGIKYYPTSPSTTNRFRITGLSYNQSSTVTNGGIWIHNPSATKEYIRIDHNALSNSTTSYLITTTGSIMGVIDNNTITYTFKAFSLSGTGNGTTETNLQWDNIARNYGDIDNLYIEDNIITGGTDAANVASIGSRYAFRYNTMTTKGSGMLDMHGNQMTASCLEDTVCGSTGTMMAEVYSNIMRRVNATGDPIALGRLNDIRGGKSLHFYNWLSPTNSNTSTILTVREEYADDQWPVNDYVQKVTESYMWANWEQKVASTYLIPATIYSENCCSISSAWQPNHTYRSAGCDYYCQQFTGNANCWKLSMYGDQFDPDLTCTSPYQTGSEEPNWASVSPRYGIQDGDVRWVNMGPNTSPIVENVDFWTQKTGTFDGGGVNGGGVGCGTLATIQAGGAAQYCTKGVAFWVPNATIDPNAASCTNPASFTGTEEGQSLVGANNTLAASVNGNIGTLYKCVSNNTWDNGYYTPYKYPHELRDDAGSDTIAPGFSTASINDAGTTLTVELTEDVTVNTNTGFAITCSGGAATLTYVSESGGDLTYTISRPIQQSEGNCTLAYTEGEDLITDAAGNELKSFSDGVVVNGSQQNTPPTVTLTISSHTGATAIATPSGTDATINCGSTCSASYDNGTSVVVQGSCLANYQNMVIGGDCAPTTGEVTVTGEEGVSCTVTCSKIAADAKVGAGNPGQRVGAGNPAHKRY